MTHFESLLEMHRVCRLPPPEHPLLSIFAFDRPPLIFPASMEAFTGDFYHIALKKIRSGMLLYGRTPYDPESGSMYFGKPRQVIELKNLQYEEEGFFICFHEDYIRGNALHPEIANYGFFDYEVNEALHLSHNEEAIVRDLYRKIETEYYNNQDEMSREIILSHLGSMLKYGQRFYRRQFIFREGPHSEVQSRFEQVLRAYLAADDLEERGLPTVQYMAEQMHLSARYLSDLLKARTGKTALEHIHLQLINEAKNLLLTSGGSVGETAYRLGFEHPSYFSRLFKKKVGMTPGQYRDRHRGKR